MSSCIKLHGSPFRASTTNKTQKPTRLSYVCYRWPGGGTPVPRKAPKNHKRDSG